MRSIERESQDLGYEMRIRTSYVQVYDQMLHQSDNRGLRSFDTRRVWCVHPPPPTQLHKAASGGCRSQRSSGSGWCEITERFERAFFKLLCLRMSVPIIARRILGRFGITVFVKYEPYNPVFSPFPGLRLMNIMLLTPENKNTYAASSMTQWGNMSSA